MKAQRGGREERRPRVKPRPHDRQTDRRHIVFGIEPVREMLAADAAAIHTLYVRDAMRRGLPTKSPGCGAPAAQ